MLLLQGFPITIQDVKIPLYKRACYALGKTTVIYEDSPVDYFYDLPGGT